MECRWLLLEYFCFTFQESYADFYYSKECILFSFTIAIFLYWRLRTVTSRPSLALLPMHDPVDSSGFILHLEHSDDIVLLIFVTTEVGGVDFGFRFQGVQSIVAGWARQSRAVLPPRSDFCPLSDFSLNHPHLEGVHLGLLHYSMCNKADSED